MPQRIVYAWWFFFGILGAVFVVVLFLLGRDIRKASGHGPAWRRRLVLAGVALLSAAGVAVTGKVIHDVADTVSIDFTNPLYDPPRDEMMRLELADTPPWRRLMVAWAHAEEVTSGSRGSYPFDEAGKQSLLDELHARFADIDKLTDARQLCDAEATLLKEELRRLDSGVCAFRTTEMQGATCYLPFYRAPGDENLERLTLRLPLLEQLADSQRLQPKAMDKIVATFEADLEAANSLEWQKHVTQRLTDPDVEEGRWPKVDYVRNADETIRKAKAALARIHARLEGRPAPQTAPAEEGA